MGLWRHMLWIFDQNSVDKHNVLAVAAQCLHSMKAFLFLSLSPTATSGWEGTMGKRLRGHTAGTADLW